MEITLRQIIQEGTERHKLEYKTQAEWVPPANTVICTGNHRVKVFSSQAEVNSENCLYPVALCRMSRNMKNMVDAVNDGWVVVEETEREREQHNELNS